MGFKLAWVERVCFLFFISPSFFSVSSAPLGKNRFLFQGSSVSKEKNKSIEAASPELKAKKEERLKNYLTMIRFHQKPAPVKQEVYNSPEVYNKDAGVWIGRAIQKRILLFGKKELDQAVVDPHVSDSAFSLMFLLAHNPRELFETLLFRKMIPFLKRVEGAMAYEKEVGVHHMKTLMEKTAVFFIAQDQPFKVPLLITKFKLNQKNLVSQYTQNQYLADELLYRAFLGDWETFDRLNKTVQLPASMTSISNVFRNSPGRYKKSKKTFLDMNDDERHSVMERLSVVLRFYEDLKRFPSWTKYHMEEIKVLQLRMFTMARKFGSNREALNFLEFILVHLQIQLAPQYLIGGEIRNKQEYDKAVSHILYFSAQRGYKQYKRAKKLFVPPVALVMGNNRDKENLIRSALLFTDAGEQGEARRVLAREIEVRKW